MKILFLLIFILLLNLPAVLGNNNKAKAIGVYVKFKEYASNEKRIALHNRLTVLLEYRSNKLLIDFVKFKHGGNVLAYRSLCEKYMRSNLVVNCEITYQYNPPFEKQAGCCSQSNSSIAPQAEALTEIMKHIKPVSSCELAFRKGLPDVNKGLTPLWSQEYIGADLSRDLLKAYDGDTPVTVGNIDSPYSLKHLTGEIKITDETNIEIKEGKDDVDHATSTVNLINGQLPIGTSENAVITHMYDILNAPGRLLGAVDVWASDPPEVTNLEIHTLHALSRERVSYRFNTTMTLIKEMIGELSKNSLVVAATGNEYPIGSIRDNSDGLRIVLVGNMNEYGLVDSTSDESENVAIVAPAGERQMTYNTAGYDPHWGGTSGAMPLVTGALADVKSIIKELSFEDAKWLLEKTALPTSNRYQRPRKNGPGMLNVFKMTKTAIRLKDRGWPENKENLLKDASVFDFQEEARKLKKDGANLLKKGDCEKQKMGFSMIRSSFLLDPKEEVAFFLAKIYEKLGYKKNAIYYRNYNKQHLKQFIYNQESLGRKVQLDYIEKQALLRAKGHLIM